jgi:dTDP-4-dehydrorhamnose 3,5-epimerase
MKFEPTDIAGAFIVSPLLHPDERGFFSETYRKDRFREAGIMTEFVLDSQSRSRQGVVRGLHFQWEPPMAKTVRVGRGRAFFAALDIRKDSPTFRRSISIELSDELMNEVYLPSGCAGGFTALSEWADVLYKQSCFHAPNAAGTILWNDPVIGIEWPVVGTPLLSEKDRTAQTLEEWLSRPESDLVA